MRAHNLEGRSNPSGNHAQWMDALLCFKKSLRPCRRVWRSVKARSWNQLLAEQEGGLKLLKIDPQSSSGNAAALINARGCGMSRRRAQKLSKMSNWITQCQKLLNGQAQWALLANSSAACIQRGLHASRCVTFSPSRRANREQNPDRALAGSTLDQNWLAARNARRSGQD